MKNPDALKQQKEEILNRMNQAVQDGNTEEFAKIFVEYSEILQEAVLAEARGLVNAADNQALIGRGARVLTSEENQYYQKVIEAMKSSDPKQSLAGFDKVLPKTVIDAVFEDITEEHPLLSAIDFRDAEAMLEYLYSTLDGRHLASWGALCDEITKQLSSEFKMLNFSQTKLSAWLPVCKAMLDLGPAWLDRYVRAMLAEAIANGLEDGIINGRGVAEEGANPTTHPAINEPVGMIRDVSKAATPGVGLPAKVEIPIADFSPETYGGLIAQLAVNRNGLFRRVPEVLLVVNPVDYFTKIFPATTIKTPNGTYVNNIFPFPTRVVQSAYMEQGKAILGIAKRYIMAIGTGKGGKIEYSDEYKFLEDERTYLVKLYGTGRPKDDTSFLYLDISNLKPLYPIVRVTDYVDARLSGIDLTDEKNNDVDYGTFSKNIHYYTAAIADVASAGDNNAATLEVTAADDNATFTVTLNGTAVSASDGAYALTLTEGQNVVVITSTVGAESEAYVLVITYTPKEA